MDMQEMRREAVNAYAAGGFVGIESSSGPEFLDFVESRLGEPPGSPKARLVFNLAQDPDVQEEALGLLQRGLNNYASWRHGTR